MAKAGVVPHPSAVPFKPTPRPDGALSASAAKGVTAGTSADSVIFKRGLVEFYDGEGQLRVKLLDPDAQFAFIEDPTLNAGEQRPGGAPQIVVPIGGLNDWLTNKAKRARASDQTQTDVLLSLSERVKVMEAGLGELRGELTDIWIQTSIAEEERRRMLFARWDECEGGAVQTDPTRAKAPPAEVLEIRDPGVALTMYRAHAGDRARYGVESFVREKLPKDGPQAYSESELAALNKTRKSARPFAPYDAVTTRAVALTPKGPLGAPEGPKPPT